MSKFNTGNPVGSADPRDLADNAQVADKLVNGDSDSYLDRRGNGRKSWSGIEADHVAAQASRESEFDAAQATRSSAFNALLVSSGYSFLANYSGGLSITAYTQLVRESGSYWRLKPAISLPYTTTGTWIGDDENNFVNVSDALLRQELADSADPAEGTALVGHVPVGSSSASNAKAAFDELHADTGAAVVGSDDGRATQFHITSSESVITSPAELYRALYDPNLPLPAFFEGWSVNTFNGVSNLAPTAPGIPTGDTDNDLLLEYTVSGTVGDSVLSISAGNESLGTGTWGGVIQHDDGTYGLYTIYGVGSGQCSIFPDLRATTTSQTLRNIAAGVNGQHMTRPAYKAMARAIFAETVSGAYRGRLAAKWDADLDGVYGWVKVIDGFNDPQISTINPFIGSGDLQYTWTSKAGTLLKKSVSGAAKTGKGVSRVFSLHGRPGLLECFVSAVADAAAFSPVNVKLDIDGVEVYNQNHLGLYKVSVEHPAGDSAQLFVTLPGEDGSTSTNINISAVNFWEYDRALTGSDPVIDSNANLVVLGDSWTQWADATLGAELQQAMIDDSGTGTVTTVGLGGTKAEWGLDQFDSQVAPLAPDQVLIHFYINDYNTYGVAGYAKWLSNLYKIGKRCQAIGAQPVLIMPLPTASIAQAANLLEYSVKSGAGIER